MGFNAGLTQVRWRRQGLVLYLFYQGLVFYLFYQGQQSKGGPKYRILRYISTASLTRM